MNKKQEQRLKRSRKRDKNRKLFLGKENKELQEMDNKIRQVFPDKIKRQEYIEALYKALGEKNGKRKNNK